MTNDPRHKPIMRSGLDRCFFCGTQFTYANLSKDHVFPEIIGGWFTVDFVCRQCNSQFGSSFDSDLRKNAFVHAALKSLGTNPHYLKGQRITWTSPLGHSGRMGVPKGHGKPVIINSKQSDGSVIADDRLFINRMKREVRDIGWTDEEIRDHLMNVVNSAPLGILVPVVKPGSPIVTWFIRHGTHITIQYDDMTAPIRFALVAKIAVELWCAFGFPSAGPINPKPIIDSVLANDPSGLTVISHAVRPKGTVYDLHYSPFHYCSFGVFGGIAIGLIGFFGFLSYAVALGRVEAPDIGDWRSDFWIFPAVDRNVERKIFQHNPSPDEMRFEFARMGVAAELYRSRIGANEGS